MTGAPGSKWSGVARSIHGSISIDQTDLSPERTYIGVNPAQSLNRNGTAFHTGAYWDPGMEFEIHEWDKPFSGEGVRLIKSHTFAHHLNELKKEGHPIVMVYRNDFECMNQWMQVGGFNITYPNYKPYYKNPENMWTQIVRQNRDIMEFIQSNRHRISRPATNVELCKMLDISINGIGDDVHGPMYNFHEKDKQVYVYR